MVDQYGPGLDIVVVGQTPRTDVELLFAPFVGIRSLRIVGALDGLSYMEICAAKPVDDADKLVTFLNSESGAPAGPVVVSKRLVEQRACDIFRVLASTRHGARLLFCTGDFLAVSDLGGVIVPSHTVAALVNALQPRGTLGVFAPLPELARAAARKWAAPGRLVVAESLAIDADETASKKALAAMALRKPDFVVLDCLTYQPTLQSAVRQATAAPTLLPISLLQHLAAQLAL